MNAKFYLALRLAAPAALLSWLGCADGAAPSGPQGASGMSGGGGSSSNASAGQSPGGAAASGAGTASGGSGGRVESPGMQPSQCAGPPPEQVFALSSGSSVTSPGPYVVLTGTLPPNIEGSPVANVAVKGAARGARMDAERRVWTYFLAAPSGALDIVAKSEAGASTAALSANVTVGDAALPARDLEHGQRSVGTWMFTWFSGDPSWECSSAWRPIGGFKGWDGSVAWARDQLLDQIDAHLDAVGLQLDTPTSEGNQGYRFANIVHVVDAARQLLEEGVAPPRLFPFLDSAIISDHYQHSNGAVPNLSTDAGRAYFYGHARAFYQAAQASLGDVYHDAGIARFGAGLPAVATWHSEGFSGVDNASVLDFKARFEADFGRSCYFIAHPNDWRNFDAVDEITQMVGPPEHYLKTGHDGGGNATINIEAGFWNPTSNTFYLPRQGGVHFDEAWQSAQAQRESARHIWIDTWNETGEGSGMFAADTLSYSEADQGPCGKFVNRHQESWGTQSRQYIDVTRAQASRWNDAPDLDAQPLASDAPAGMKPGEQRYITVVMQNTGDATWISQRLGLSADSAAADFHVAAPASAQADALSERFGGVARGLPGVFTVLVTAPCASGVHTLSLEMLDASSGRFGRAFSIDVSVAP